MTIDTVVKLAQCPRCSAYVYLAESAGLRSAADPAPATREAYIAALTSGRRTFDLLEHSGRPHKLLVRTLTANPPAFAPDGAQTVAEGARKVLAEHGCGAHAKSMAAVVAEEEAEAGPKVPATPGGASGGNHPATAPAAAPTPSCPAGPVTPHRSDVHGGLPPYADTPEPSGSHSAREDVAAWHVSSPAPSSPARPASPSVRHEPGNAPQICTNRTDSAGGAQGRPPTATSSASAASTRPAPGVHQSSRDSRPLPGGTPPGASTRSAHIAEPTPKCGLCHQWIKPREEFWGFQVGVKWEYAEHVDC